MKILLLSLILLASPVMAGAELKFDQERTYEIQLNDSGLLLARKVKWDKFSGWLICEAAALTSRDFDMGVGRPIKIRLYSPWRETMINPQQVRMIRLEPTEAEREAELKKEDEEDGETADPVVPFIPVPILPRVVP